MDRSNGTESADCRQQASPQSTTRPPSPLPSLCVLPRLCCRLYFGESNVEGMLQVLLPLHEKMEREGPSTLKEIAFVQVSGGGVWGGGGAVVAAVLVDVGGAQHTQGDCLCAGEFFWGGGSTL